jgi:hypothetical protein
MNKKQIAKVFVDAKKTLAKHSPEILTGVGIAGMITTTVLAVRATPKAMMLIEEKKQADGVEKLKAVEVVKTTWRCYVPTIVTGALATSCLIGATNVSIRRSAALATAYKLSETALTEYREKVVEAVGEKKEQVIKEKVGQSRLEKDPVSTSEVIITKKGNTLCYDYMSGRYFESDIDLIKSAQNNVNERLINSFCGSVSLNDLYDELNLEHIGIGDTLGWNTDQLIDIHIGYGGADDGRPCIIISHNNPPKYDY